MRLSVHARDGRIQILACGVVTRLPYLRGKKRKAREGSVRAVGVCSERWDMCVRMWWQGKEGGNCRLGVAIGSEVR